MALHISSNAGARQGDAGRVIQREAGFALLLVLWTMSLLALVGTQITAGGRSETRVASALYLHEQLQAAADAAVQETIWHMLPGGRAHWDWTNAERRLDEGSLSVAVQVIDERGKLDLNVLREPLIASFFDVLGTDRRSSRLLASRIVSWRTSFRPEGYVPPPPPTVPASYDGPQREFQALDDLLLLPGMTPALYRAATPHLVFNLGQTPIRQLADTVVLATLDQNQRETKVTEAPPEPSGRGLVEIRATVRDRGAAFTRRVQVSFDPAPQNGGALYRVLGWDTGTT